MKVTIITIRSLFSSKRIYLIRLLAHNVLDPPTSEDKALTDAQTRQHICNDMTRNGLFYHLKADPVNMNDRSLYIELQQSKYVEIFRQIYDSAVNPPADWPPNTRTIMCSKSSV